MLIYQWPLVVMFFGWMTTHKHIPFFAGKLKMRNSIFWGVAYLLYSYRWGVELESSICCIGIAKMYPISLVEWYEVFIYLSGCCWVFIAAGCRDMVAICWWGCWYFWFHSGLICLSSISTAEDFDFTVVVIICLFILVWYIWPLYLQLYTSFLLNVVMG